MQEKRMEVQEGGDHVGKIKVTNFQFFVRSETPLFNLLVLDRVTQGCNSYDLRLPTTQQHSFAHILSSNIFS